MTVSIARHLPSSIATLTATTLLLAGCGQSDDAADPPASTGAATNSATTTATSSASPTAEPVDAESLVGYVEASPDQTGLVVLRAGDPEPVVSVSPDELMPLASTRKVLVLLAVADAVAGGTLDPAEPVVLEDVERWYAPGTDGGAHEAAVAELGPAWTVQTVVQAMITYSDNAAADWLLERVGGSAEVDRVSASYGMVAQEPAWPFLGELLAWELEPEAWLEATPDERVGIASRFADEHPTGPVEITLPPVEEQRELSAVSSRGTALEWAWLMDAVVDGAAEGDPVAAYALDVLSWPLAIGDNAATYSIFADKGGSLPGMLTEATVIQPEGGERLTVVQLYRNLPPDVEASVVPEFIQQQLLAQLAQDPAFLADVAGRLGSGS